MVYEIIFCFFTAFGIIQILEIIKGFCLSKIQEDITMVVDVNDDTNVETLNKELEKKSMKLVFVYSGVNAKKLEVLKRKFEYASFIKREDLSLDMQKLL